MREGSISKSECELLVELLESLLFVFEIAGGVGLPAASIGCGVPSSRDCRRRTRSRKSWLKRLPILPREEDLCKSCTGVLLACPDWAGSGTFMNNVNSTKCVFYRCAANKAHTIQTRGWPVKDQRAELPCRITTTCGHARMKYLSK